MSIALDNPDLKWSEPSCFARMPVFTLYMVAVLRNKILEFYPQAFLVLLFSIHAWAYVALFEGFTRVKLKQLHKPAATFFFFITLVFIFWPNNYEIHLWHIEALHGIGTLCVAYSFKFKNIFFRYAMIVLAFLTYETFVLLFFGFSTLLLFTHPDPFFSKKPRQEFLKNIGLMLLAGFFSLAVKLTLEHHFGGAGQMLMEKRPQILFNNFRSLIRTIWHLHYYRTNWVTSSLKWIGMSCILYSLLKRKTFTLLQVVFLLLIPTLSAFPLILLTYSARRAFYGPQILQALVFSYFFYSWFLQDPHEARKKYSALGICALLFLYHWGATLFDKNANFNTLKKAEEIAMQAFKNCLSPCRVTLPSASKDLTRGDYILDNNQLFYGRIARQHFAEKKIEILISD